MGQLAHEKLNAEVRDRINDPGETVMVSAATVWEVAIKVAARKLAPPEPLTTAVLEEGFEPLPISLEHAEQAGGLPLHHGDPFDRLLIAQAQIEGLTLVSRDRSFDAYDVKVLRC